MAPRRPLGPLVSMTGSSRGAPCPPEPLQPPDPVPDALVRDSRGHPTLWDRQGPCALPRLPMATQLSSSAGMDRITTGWGCCCAHGQQLCMGQGEIQAALVPGDELISTHVLSHAWPRAGSISCILAGGRRRADPTGEHPHGEMPGNTTTQLILGGNRLLHCFYFSSQESRTIAKARAAADQQTGHQLGTLNLPNPSLTKANVSTTAPISCKNHWLPLALGARKFNLCLY